jgi:hypothetical protein
MKNKFQQIISGLFTASFCDYIENCDDEHSGFEFNPNEPRTMIRVLFTLNAAEQQPDASIYIDSFTIIPYDSTIMHKRLFGGKIVLQESGDVDYNFYETMLKYWRRF